MGQVPRPDQLVEEIKHDEIRFSKPIGGRQTKLSIIMEAENEMISRRRGGLDF